VQCYLSLTRFVVVVVVVIVVDAAAFIEEFIKTNKNKRGRTNDKAFHESFKMCAFRPNGE